MLREPAGQAVARPKPAPAYEIRPARRADLALLVADVPGFPIAQLTAALIHDEDLKANGTRSGYLYGLRVFGPYRSLGYRAIRERHRNWSYVDPDGGTRQMDVNEVLLRKAL